MSGWFGDSWDFLGWLFFHEQVEDDEQREQEKQQQEELEDAE